MLLAMQIVAYQGKKPHMPINGGKKKEIHWVFSSHLEDK